MTPRPRRPERIHTLTELPRASLEAARLALRFEAVAKEAPRGDGHTVLALPSYGMGDFGTTALRHFLKRIGYVAPPSGIGWNADRGELRIRRIEDATRFRSRQVDRVVERIEALHAAAGEPISLVGWSMGGLFAVDAAQRLPQLVRRVVTLGSPFGDPRGTSLWDLLRWLSGSRVPVEEQDFGPWLDRTALATDEVPVTVIFSASDGIVGREVARLQERASVEHVEVESSHLGLAANPAVFLQLARALARRAAPSAAGLGDSA